MSRLFSLIKTNLRANFGVSVLKYYARTNPKKLLGSAGILLAIVVGFGSLAIAVGALMDQIYGTAIQLNQPELVITISFLMAQLLVLFFGIFYVMSVFYFSKDIQFLIPLPLRPYEVLGSKFVEVILYEYITLIPLLLPALFIYGRGTDQGLLYWGKALLVFLASPVLPLVLATLFVVVLMRFINLRKHKDKLAVIGGLLGFILAMGINFFMNNQLQTNNIENVLTSQIDFIKLVGQRFPPSIWATLGITQNGAVGLGNLALLIGVSLLLFIGLLWVSNVFFYRGLLSGQEVSQKRKALTEEEMEKRYNRSSSPVVAIFWREWKLLLRTPVYVLNCFAGIIIGPIFIIMPFITGQEAGLTMAVDFLKEVAPIYYVLIGSGLLILFSGTNAVAPTAVSREGKDFWLSKMIPMAPRDQMRGKLLHSIMITFMTIIVGLLTFFLVFKLPWLDTLWILALAFLGSTCLVIVGMIIDVIHPKLEWTNPQEAVKRNINVLFQMLASIGYIGLFFLLTKVFLKTNLAPIVIYLIFAAITGALCILFRGILFRLADKKYQRIEG